MSAFAHRVQRALIVPMLCGVLLFWQHAPLVAYQQDRPDSNATLPQGAVSDSGLAALEVAPGDEDRDRLFQLLEGARILAESGAGYEAARVLAGLALQAGHQDPGREALQLLESWGLSIAAVRSGQPTALNVRISQSIQESHRDDILPLHVRNLITMQRFDQAARVVRSSLEGQKPGRVEDRWRALFERYRVPLSLLQQVAGHAQEGGSCHI